MASGYVTNTNKGYMVMWNDHWYGYFRSHGDAQRWLYNQPR